MKGEVIKHWHALYMFCYILNRLISQMQATLAAPRELAGKLWQLCKVWYVSEQKNAMSFNHAQFTRIVISWHIGNVLLMIS